MQNKGQKRRYALREASTRSRDARMTFILPVFFNKIWDDGRYVTTDINKVVTVRSISFVGIGGG